MDERSAAGHGPLRRAVLRVLPTPVDVVPDEHLWVQDAPPMLHVLDDLAEPRIADLDALLRDLDDLRGTLRQDLALAATALEAGEPELAAWLVDQPDDLGAFERRALSHLGALAQLDVADDGAPGLTGSTAAPAATAGRRHRRLLSAAPFAAAAAVVFAFVSGVAAPPEAPRPSEARIDSAALASYEAFTRTALEGGTVSEISAAAERFHDDLGPLLASPLTDPAAVTHAIWLLQSERAVLIAGGDSSGALNGVLREADRIAARLRAGLARRLPAPVTNLVPVDDRDRRDKSAPSRQQSSPKPASEPRSSTAAQPSPTPTPTPTPTPSPSPSAAQPSPQPTDSGEPTDPPTVLPKAPPGL